MTNTAPLQNPQLTAHPARTGRIAVAVVVVSATALAFGLAYVTTDWSLGPRQRMALEQIRRMEGLFKIYHRTMGRFPTEEEGFTPLLQARVLEAVPSDPWGRPYVYQFNNERTGIVSFGADGVPGGEGEDADINSGGLLKRRR